MSVQQMGRVWASDLEPNLKLVALALADHADDRGWCWPSIATIAAKTGYSRRQTQRLVRQLGTAGYVTIHEAATHVRSPTYRLDPDRLTPRRGDNLTPPHRDQRREFDDPERGDISDARGDTDVTPGVTPETSRGDTGVTRTVSEPSDEPSDEPSLPEAGDALPVEVIHPSEIRPEREATAPPPAEAPSPLPVPARSTARYVELHDGDDVPVPLDVQTRNPRSDLWDSFEALFGYRPRGSEARLWGKLVGELVDMDADPADVPIRAERLARQWGPDKLTPTSLVKHWQRFGTALGLVTMTDRDRDDFIERQRLDDALAALPDNALGRGDDR